MTNANHFTNTAVIELRIGSRQEFALFAWVLDHASEYEDVYELPPFAARLDGSRLVFSPSDSENVRAWLVAASNLADDYAQRANGDARTEFAADSAALAKIAHRVTSIHCSRLSD